MNKKDKTHIAKNIAIIAGIFCLIISILLTLNYWQLQASDPLESRALETLVNRLSQEPGNEELKQEIRNLDLLARKAYFTSLWQIRTGGFLLLFSAVVMVIALRIYHKMNTEINKPGDEEDDEITKRVLSQKWIMAVGGIIIVSALVMAFVSRDPLERYAQEIRVESEPDADPDADPVEHITVTDVEPSQDIVEEDEVAETIDEHVVADEEETGVEPGIEPGTGIAHFPDEQTIMQNHNAFRGPFGDGISLHTGLPVEWDGDSGENILWKIPVPLHGYNSPVIWEDKLFFAGADEEKSMVFCYNKHTGELLWERIVDDIPGSPAEPPETTDDTGLSAPSLTTDGIGVYAIFGTGDIIAFDMEGTRLWAKNLGVPDNHYGHSSSLLSYEEKLFVQYDDFNSGRIICLNVETGETIWDIERDSDISWASPILAKVGGEYQLVVKGNPIVAGYDIETGDELWAVDAMSGEVGPSPAYNGELVFAAQEYAKMVAIDPLEGTQVWESRHYLPEVSSPVSRDDLLFISTTYAVIACFEAETGELIWEYDADGIFYSSPVIADDKLWVTDTGGKTYIFELDRNMSLVNIPSLGEEVYTVPAFSDGMVYIRGEQHLYCIGK